ncbi:hypothetical protein TcCL_ESM04319 [Trypanosoma cruzi]|nr:hypothetical protein TcCL_ESM04319 [Trypanosoma cruzi]
MQSSRAGCMLLARRLFLRFLLPAFSMQTILLTYLPKRHHKGTDKACAASAIWHVGTHVLFRMCMRESFERPAKAGCTSARNHFQSTSPPALGVEFLKLVT